jgi:hypothetical protein
MQIGDLVKHSTRSVLLIGIVTDVRGSKKEKPYGVDVLWLCGRHSSHANNHLQLLEVICK